jgi:hypothetical protein
VLAKLRRDAEIKWAQRAKVKHIQEGCNNTKYFPLIANGKHRRKKIFQLEQDKGTTKSCLALLYRVHFSWLS